MTSSLDTPSDYLVRVADRAASMSETDARLRALLSTPFYRIVVTPRGDKPFLLEMDWAATVSKRLTLDRLVDGLFAGWTAVITYHTPNALPVDVSTDFAKTWARELFESGCDLDAVCDIGFIGRYLTNSEIAECRS